MWLDFLALGVLGFFAGMGAVRGGLAAGLSLLTLVGAYAAAIGLAPAWGPAAGELTGAPGWLGVALAGTAAFLAAFLLLSLVSVLWTRRDRRQHAHGRSPRDRFLGGVFGALRGGLVVLLLAYLALWVDALGATGTVEGLPQVGSSSAAAVTGSVVEAGLGAALGEGSGGRVMARVAARPGQALADLQQLMDHPAMAQLRGDAAFWTYVEHGAVDAAMNRRSFAALAGDAELRARLGELGLIEEAAVQDPRSFRVAVREVLLEVGPRLRGLREDPELQALLEDPEVVSAVQSGDHLALVSHPGFRSVVARAMESD